MVLSMHASVCASRNIVNTMSCGLFNILFSKFTSTVHYGTEMNTSHFGVKGQGHGGIKCAGNSTFWAC